MSGLGIAARDALRRTIIAAMQAGGTRRPEQGIFNDLMVDALNQVEHAMVLDRARAAALEQDPQG